MEELIERSERAARLIEDYKGRVHIFSHNDADGIAAAGILCNALLRKKRCFQVSILKSFRESVLEDVFDDELVVFCDMGSNNIRELEGYGRKMIVLDHHIPHESVNAEDILHVNPHLVGMDGGKELSASGVSYLVARALGDNKDLSYLALVGALGDKQEMIGGNRSIRDEALANDIIEIKKGAKIGGEDLLDGLTYSVDPYFDFSGEEDKVKEFLNELNIGGEIFSLSEEEMRVLCDALTLKLVKHASPDAIRSFVGEIYSIRGGGVKNLLFLMDLLNSCGKMGKSGLALSLCLKDLSVMEEAKKCLMDFKIRIITELKDLKKRLKRGDNLQYMKIENKGVTGEIASSIIRYISPDLPILVLNEDKKENKIRVSARGTDKLIDDGLDLSITMKISAEKVGGSGGGHKIASGASIPTGKEEKFLEIADAMIGKQIR
ncbi:MAG: DHHA1 domain protein [Candidatus Methanolliviera sp. GoM_asphalt]|nr:MAG: DHHA1 domain protein [Candidatus Methanolliviera sp. GoM_asphalt]